MPARNTSELVIRRLRANGLIPPVPVCIKSRNRKKDNTLAWSAHEINDGITTPLLVGSYWTLKQLVRAHWKITKENGFTYIQPEQEE